VKKEKSMSFKIHSKETAPAESIPYLQGFEQHVGFIPNLIGVIAESPATLASVSAVNQAIEQGNLSPVERRVVTVTVSAENNCAYCVPAQSTLAKMADMEDDILAQIRSGQSLSDRKLDALRSFTLKVIHNKGWVPEPDVREFINAGYEAKHVMEVITLVALMTLTNYVSHLASLPLDEAFIPQQWDSESVISA
jgi:uncharacterized peroxidase-related enzyme